MLFLIGGGMFRTGGGGTSPCACEKVREEAAGLPFGTSTLSGCSGANDLTRTKSSSTVVEVSDDDEETVPISGSRCQIQLGKVDVRTYAWPAELVASRDEGAELRIVTAMVS